MREALTVLVERLSVIEPVAAAGAAVQELTGPGRHVHDPADDLGWRGCAVLMDVDAAAVDN
jgi:hypothetical protein